MGDMPDNKTIILRSVIVLCVMGIFFGIIAFANNQGRKENTDKIIVHSAYDTSEEISQYTDAEIEENETEVRMISKKEYNVDGEEMTLALFEKNEDISFYTSANVKSEEKAAVMLITLKSTFEDLGVVDYSISIHFGELYLLYKNTKDGVTVVGDNRDGTTALQFPDWVPEKLTMSETDFSSYTEEILSALKDFGEIN